MTLKNISTEQLMAELEERNVTTVWRRDYIELTAKNHVGIELSEEQISEVVKELSTQSCLGSGYDIMVRHCISSKFLARARYWVLGMVDEYGYSNEYIKGFSSEEKARAHADSRNDFSEGIIHKITEDSWEAHDYCRKYNIDFYLHEYTNN